MTNQEILDTLKECKELHLKAMKDSDLDDLSEHILENDKKYPNTDFPKHKLFPITIWYPSRSLAKSQEEDYGGAYFSVSFPGADPLNNGFYDQHLDIYEYLEPIFNMLKLEEACENNFELDDGTYEDFVSVKEQIKSIEGRKEYIKFKRYTENFN